MQVLDREVEPVANATVTLGNHTREADALGLARFEDVPVGRHHVTAAKPGYLDGATFVVVTEDSEAQVRVVLIDPPPARIPKLWIYSGDGSCAGAAQNLPGSEPCPDRPIPMTVDGDPDGEAVPPFPAGFNVTVNWSGPVKRFRIRLSFGSFTEGEVPFRDGRRNLTLEGPSPIRFEVAPALVWGRMARGGPLALHFEATDAPPDFTQPYLVRGDAVGLTYIDENRAPRWKALPTTNLTATVGGPPLTFEHAPDLDHVYVRHQVVGTCPVSDFGPVSLRLVDPGGREETVILSETDDPPMPTLACPPLRPVRSTYLLHVPGTWSLRAEGDCDCSVKIEVVPVALVVPP